MESLSSVATIVRIAQDIAGAVATVSRNKRRCRKLAKRVHGIGDLLRELHGSGAGVGTTDAATRRLLDRLEDALRRALELVRSCGDSSCPRNLLAGGRQAERFDEVDGEIDRCLLDLASVANRILIARLEKLLLHQNAVRYRDPASTETLTLRIGMPCDDSAQHIKRCIHMMQGVTDVAAAASTKEQFRVTIRSGAVDIPSFLEQVKEKLNRNVELITPAASGAVRWDDVKDEKANRGVPEDNGDKQKHCRYASGGDEIDKEKAAAIAAAANKTNNTGLNHAPTPYAYLPFAVALVPIATDASMCQAPSLPYSFLPYPQGPPGNAQPYRHRGPTPKKYGGGGGDRKDTGVKDDGDKHDDSKTEKVAAPAESGSDKKKEPVPTGAGERKYKDKTAAGVGAGNITIGVPVRTVNAGKDDDTKTEKVGAPAERGSDKKKEPVPTGSGERKDKDKTAAGAGAGNVTIGVPVRTVNAGMHELVPPPSYGHWPYAQGFVIDGYYHDGAGAPSGAAASYYHHHSPYPEVPDPDMFSDENPNACTVI